jgi:AFG3 family protein
MTGEKTSNAEKPLTKDSLTELLTPSPLFLGLSALALAYSLTMGRSDVQEISFQHFKTQLLAKDMVEKLEVTNKSTVKVYVRQSPR